MSAAASGQTRFARADARAVAKRVEAARLLAEADGIDRQAAAIAKGNEGERLIGRLLDELRDEGWVVLHDRRKSSASPANLDHVVVGPMGVCVIDAKNWSGGRLRLDDRGMAVKKWRKDDELHAAKVDADIVGEAAREHLPAVQTCGVLAFVNDMGLGGPQRHGDVALLQREHLLSWLRSLPTHLTPEQVASLGAALELRLPPRSVAVAGPAPAAPPVLTSVGARLPPAWAPEAPRAPTRGQRRAEARAQKRRRELRSLLVRLMLLLVLVACIPLLPGLLMWLSETVAPLLTEVVTPAASAP